MQPRQRPGKRLGWLVATISASALALLGIVAIPASATNPGADGKLAFTQTNSSGNRDIWTINPDGTGLTQLTSGGNHFSPTWSPDGGQMAFVYFPFAIGNPLLGVMNADGTANRTVSSALATGTDAPSWSSDGTLLAYTQTFRGINTLNVATGATAPLIITGPGSAPGNGVEARYPSYSPDGRYLAWIRSEGSGVRLMLSAADGTNSIVLREWTVENPFLSIAGPPHWHPDSLKIEWDLQIGPDVHHVRMGIDGAVLFNAIENLGQPNPPVSPSSGGGWLPSPMGDRLIVRAPSPDSSQSMGNYIANLDGSLIARLPDPPSGVSQSRITSWQSMPSDEPTDTAAPVISVISPVAGADIVLGAALSASFSCADENGGSGLASCAGTVANGAPLDTSVIGDKSFTVTATDNAGNTAFRTVSYRVVPPASSDTTDPTISVVSPVAGAETVQGTALNAAFTCADESGGSGVASCVGTVANGAALNTSAVGEKSFTVTATDNAGNTGTRTVSYRVVWPFSNFVGSVDPLPTLNATKAGGVIPVRFSLGGDRGLGILAAGYPVSAQIGCDLSSPVDLVEETASSPGANTLSYDAATGQYAYNWKTNKAWKNTCRQLTFKLTDGAGYQANFRFS